jgi:hypothetical protein
MGERLCRDAVTLVTGDQCLLHCSLFGIRRKGLWAIGYYDGDL